MSVTQLYAQLDGEEVLNVSKLDEKGRGAHITPYPESADLFVADYLSLSVHETSSRGLFVALALLFPQQPHIYSKVENDYRRWLECDSDSDSDSDSSWESID